MGNARKAMGIEFFLAQSEPLPAESSDALEFIQTVSIGQSTDFRAAI